MIFIFKLRFKSCSCRKQREWRTISFYYLHLQNCEKWKITTELIAINFVIPKVKNKIWFFSALQKICIKKSCRLNRYCASLNDCSSRRIGDTSTTSHPLYLLFILNYSQTSSYEHDSFQKRNRISKHSYIKSNGNTCSNL